jgi:hypothetical protein
VILIKLLCEKYLQGIDNMKGILNFALAVILILVSGCATFDQYSSENFGIKFGILSKDEAGKYTVVETDDIPYILGAENQIFGYHIAPEKNTKYKLYNVVVLPSQPKNLEGRIVSSIDEASTSGVRSPEVISRGIITFNNWLTEGDPKGLYKTQLYINGSLADSRSFRVY